MSDKSANLYGLVSTPKRLRKQTVHILYAYWSYEGGVVLGVYRTKRRAEKARDAYVAAKHSYDGYEIFHHVVDEESP